MALSPPRPPPRHRGRLCPCAKKVHSADLFCFILEHTDELLADDLALALGGLYAGQLLVEAVAGVNADKVDVKLTALAKDLADLLALVLAQQTVVNETQVSCLPMAFGQHSRADAGINTAGQGTQHLAIADLLAQGLDGVLDKGVHLPVTGAAADLIHKVVQDLGAVLSVQDLGVELHSIQASCLILRSGHRQLGGMGNDLKAGGRLLDVIVMAHPAYILGGQRIKQRAGSIQIDQRFAVLTLGGFADLCRPAYASSAGCRSRCRGWAHPQ